MVSDIICSEIFSTNHESKVTHGSPALSGGSKLWGEHEEPIMQGRLPGMELEPVTLVVTTLLVALLAVLVAGLRLLRQLPRLCKGTVAFFHPFADGGGGGERVLWCAIQAVQHAAPTAQVVIYAREGVTAEDLVRDAAKRFNIQLDQPIQVIPLRGVDLIRPESYPRFTLLGQAAGSGRLGWEALSKLVPEVFIDTTGWAFTYPLARLSGCKVACYTHYPMVSTDMLQRVWSRSSQFNNDMDIAASPLKSAIKVVYYQLFGLLYGAAGAFANVVMVNSSWTASHIRQMWWRWSPPTLVHPPCDTAQLQRLPLDRRLKHLFLVSVAQFRPEKNHRLQLEAYAQARHNAGFDDAGQAVRVSTLKMVGSCRGADDERRLQSLQDLATELGISDAVEWHVNVPYSELAMLLGGAVGGLHTMTDEHFGISVVEYMAAGVIPIAHNSGGPKADIVLPEDGPEGLQPTGFLAETVEEYAAAITKVLAMDQRDRLKIAAAAQRRAQQFSTERFLQLFTESIQPLLPEPGQHSKDR